jgi:hypothetical protein
MPVFVNVERIQNISGNNAISFDFACDTAADLESAEVLMRRAGWQYPRVNRTSKTFRCTSNTRETPFQALIDKMKAADFVLTIFTRDLDGTERVDNRVVTTPYIERV